MKKILIIGELTGVVKDLNTCLCNDFLVQLCSAQLENVQGMTKIIKPDLTIFCQADAPDTADVILDWLLEKYSENCVLTITTGEKWHQYKDLHKDTWVDKLFRPFTKDELLQKCHQMTNLSSILHTEAKQDYKKKILVVDDSPLLLRNIKNILDKEYTVFLATSGKQALNLIPQKQPDLILLDYEMPDMDGGATFDAIKKDEDGKYIPVVFLTSISDKKTIYSVLQSNPAGYILKPPDKNKLLETIEQVLKGLR